MNTTHLNLPKISFEEKLNRVKAGNTASPQLSRKIIDIFCETPVIPTLETIREFENRQELCSVLKNPYLRAHYKVGSVETVTFHDLAKIIAKYFMDYGRERNKVTKTPSRSLTQCIGSLLKIYFICFDYIETLSHKYPFRQQYDPFIRNVFDFLQISFDEYFVYAVESDLPQYTAGIVSYCNENGISANMSLLMVFTELKSTECDIESPINEMESLPLEKFRHYVDCFVSPIATISPDTPF